MLVFRAFSALLSYPSAEMREALPEIVDVIKQAPLVSSRELQDLLKLIAELGNLLLERRRRLRMGHVVDDDRGALPCEFENDRLTNPAVAAGDDGDLVLQRHDGSP